MWTASSMWPPSHSSGSRTSSTCSWSSRRAASSGVTLRAYPECTRSAPGPRPAQLLAQLLCDRLADLAEGGVGSEVVGRQLLDLAVGGLGAGHLQRPRPAVVDQLHVHLVTLDALAA